MSARKTPARKIKAKLMWQGEIRERLSYTKGEPWFKKVAVLASDDESLRYAVEQAARAISLKAHGKECFYPQYVDAAIASFESVGILKAKRKTRRDAR